MHNYFPHDSNARNDEKKVRIGMKTTTQKARLKAIENDGYKHIIVCRSIDEFITEVNSYMGHE